MPTHTTGRPTARALSAKAKGNRPQPARRPTGSRGAGGGSGGGGTGVAPPRGGGRLVPPPLQPQPLLDLADVAAQLRQPLQAEQDALLLALRPAGGAQDALAGGHVAVQAGPGPDLGAVADVDV